MRALHRVLCTSAWLLSACVGEEVEQSSLSGRSAALAIEGPWQIPDSVLAVGDSQYVAYEGAGPWMGEQGCAGGLLAGTRLVGTFLAERYMQISLIGGYACRPIRGTSGTMSLHSVGRALDLHIPTVGDPADADNDLGDEIGEFLITNAELFGIQLIIWDEWNWGASRAAGDKGRLYTGVNPHHDHLHIELSVEAAARTEDWFSAALVPEGGRDAGSDAGGGLELDAGTAAPGSPPAAEDAGLKLPITPKPVIEPVLDDDPLPDAGIGAEPIVNAPTIYGSTCSTTPVAPGSSSGWWLGLTLLTLCRAGRAAARRGNPSRSGGPPALR